MRPTFKRSILTAAFAASGLGACTLMSNPPGMTFFVTSAGSGKGADLGGLAGADRICQALATSVGAGGRTWHAYLSTQAIGGAAAANARDRIGRGPWQNARGVVVAADLAQLHGANNIDKRTALTERGETVNGRGDTPNMHDILTGSQPEGGFIAGSINSTCNNWTQGGGEGAAMLGHHDRSGLEDTVPAKSWNSSHLSRGGCSQEALKSTGGNGLFYCFAVN